MPTSDDKTPLFQRIDRAHIAIGSLSALLIVVMVAIILPDVIARKTLSWTIPGAAEVNTLLLVMLVYLGLAGAEARQAHYSVNIVTKALPLALRLIAAILSKLLCLVFSGFLAWFTIKSAAHSYSASEESFGIVSFPVWPSRIAIALGLTMLTLQLTIGLLRLLLGKNSHPLRQGGPDI